MLVARRSTHASARLTLAATCFAVAMVQLDTTIVNLALRSLEQGLHADIAELQWVLDSYNVVYASLILTGATLGDLFGRKRFFLIGVVVFAVASMLCGFAPRAGVLIAGRALLGVGAALALPGSLSILNAAYDDDKERAHALAIWAGINAFALGIGPPVGGLIVDHLGWRWIFFAIIPVAVVSLALGWRGIAESKDPKGRSLGAPGQILAFLFLAALAFAIIQGALWILAPAALLLAALIVVEKRTSGPMIDLSVFRRPPFSAAIFTTMMTTFGIYGVLFLVPLYLQSVRHLSSVAAGLELLPYGIVFGVISPLAARLASRIGPRWLIAGGTALAGLCLLAFSLVTPERGDAWLVADLALVGVALGLNWSPILAVVAAGVPAERSGMASGLLNVARMVGATLGVAVLGSVFHAFQDFTRGMHVALAVGGVAQLAGGALSAVFITRDAQRRMRA